MCVLGEGNGKSSFEYNIKLMKTQAGGQWDGGAPPMEWRTILGSKFRENSVRQTGREASMEKAQVVLASADFS